MSRKLAVSLGGAASAGAYCFAHACGRHLQRQLHFPDGALTTVSGGTWADHSGTAGQVNVTSNQVQVTQNESEDVNAILAGQPYTSGVLYAGMDIHFSQLPGGTGGYFFHFKSQARPFSAGGSLRPSSCAAVGSFRLGISNGSNTFTTLPGDLSLGDTHRIVPHTTRPPLHRRFTSMRSLKRVARPRLTSLRRHPSSASRCDRAWSAAMAWGSSRTI